MFAASCTNIITFYASMYYSTQFDTTQISFYHHLHLKPLWVCTVIEARNHGQRTKTSDATGRDLFLSISREGERESGAIMSPTQMDLPLFQGIQDTRTDTLQIPTFRLPLFFCDLEMFYGQIKKSLFKIISDTGCATGETTFFYSPPPSQRNLVESDKIWLTAVFSQLLVLLSRDQPMQCIAMWFQK